MPLKTKISVGISSSTERIQTEGPNSDSEGDEPPDFNYLLKLPPSAGSHFLLKSEKQKFEQIDALPSKHFNVDTKFLNFALLSIPFNERHELDIDWTTQDINKMQQDAKLHHDELEKIFIKPCHAVKASKTEVKDESKSKTSVAPKDIQKWLDDILDI